MTVSAVIFDLGRVLVDWDISRGLWGDIIQTIGPQAEDSPLRRDWMRVYQSYATGGMTPEQFHREFCRITGHDLTYQEFVPRWCSIFSSMPGAEELFWELNRCIPVGLLSDTDPLHWEYLCRTWPFLQEIENPALSFQIGVQKPDKRAYLAAAGKVGFLPKQCFFTDDRPENIEGARAVGMDAEVFEGVDALRAQLAERGVL